MFNPAAPDFDVQDEAFFEAPKVALVAGPGQLLIQLTAGYDVLIDEADLGLLQGKSFYAHQSRSNVYARNRQLGYLHQLICGAEPGWVVDHLNRHSLDCRRDNLRIAGYDANAQNASYISNTTGFRGVTMERSRYRARIGAGGVYRSLGYYSTPEDAARAYDEAALTIYGKFAWTNFKRDLSPEVAELPPF